MNDRRLQSSDALYQVIAIYNGDDVYLELFNNIIDITQKNYGIIMTDNKGKLHGCTTHMTKRLMIYEQATNIIVKDYDIIDNCKVERKHQ